MQFDIKVINVVIIERKEEKEIKQFEMKRNRFRISCI